MRERILEAKLARISDNRRDNWDNRDNMWCTYYNKSRYTRVKSTLLEINW